MLVHAEDNIQNNKLDEIVIFKGALRTIYVNSFCRPTKDQNELSIYVLVKKSFLPIGSFKIGKDNYAELIGLSLTNQRRSFGLVRFHNSFGGVIYGDRAVQIIDNNTYNQGQKLTIDARRDNLSSIFIKMDEWKCTIQR